MNEFVTRSLSHGRNINTQALLTSFQPAVKYATRNGIKYDEMFYVGGWELKFAAPRVEGQLPAIIHALFK